MKKFYLPTLVLFLNLPFPVAAQNFTGVATYQSATTLDLTMDSTQISESQQKMMMEMLHKSLQKEYELRFDKTASLWKEVEQLEQGGMSMMGMTSMISGTASTLFKNIQSQEYAEQQEFFGKMFLIKDTLEKFDWNLGKETKKIGKYNCFKATAQVESIAKTFTAMENGDGDFEEEDTLMTEVVAWYTPQIPVAHGPDNYWGLPGLILELRKEKTTLLCTKVTLNPKEAVEIKPPQKGEVMTREAYRKSVSEKLRQMKEMYGGESRRAGNSGIRIPTR